MMRILIGSDYQRDPNKGAAGSEYQLIQHLRQMGHEVDEFWGNDLPRVVTHGNLHSLFETPRAFHRLIVKRQLTTKYDVIQLNQPSCYFACGRLKNELRDTLLVYRSHGLEDRSFRELEQWRAKYQVPAWRGYRKVFGQLLNAYSRYQQKLAAVDADAINVYCNDCKTYLINTYKIPESKVGVFPGGIPVQYVNRMLKEYSLHRHKKVLYVSQYAFFKAPIITAKIFNYLAKTEPDCLMTWVCDRSHHRDAQNLLSKEALVKTEFLDWMDQTQLAEVYDRHGLFVFPSFYEGFGKVFVEAMARGLCVIGSDTAGMRDIIKDGMNGYLVSVGNEQGFCASTLACLRSYETARKISMAASRAVRDLTWAQVSQKVVAFYQQKLAEKRTRSHGPS